MTRPNLHYDIVNTATGIRYQPSPSRGWAKAVETVDRLISEGRILWPSSATGRPREKKFLAELQSTVTGVSTWVGSEEVGYNYTATRELRDLLDGKLFDFPKPVSLVQKICAQITSDDDIVCDFFAGSGTTGHAVMQLNREDGGNRRFILAQAAEQTRLNSEAALAGYQNIAALSRERLRRIGSRLASEVVDSGLDIGFRTLRTDTSSFADVHLSPDLVQQGRLGFQEQSVKFDRTSEDLVFQILLAWGLELSLAISADRVGAAQTISVDHGAIVACFDKQLTVQVIRAIASQRPLRAVFRDSAFPTDADRINAEQIFAEASPSTDVKVI
jgi:adenine-specific DNA-methyltransferase